MPILKQKVNNAEKLSAALQAAREDYKSRISAVVDTARVRQSEVDAEIVALRTENDQLSAVLDQASKPVA